MGFEYSREQKEAIFSSGENIIVSAGAGSGKTAVLTERIKRILNEGTKANQLLVLTFTNAAASEMKERIVKKMLQDENLKNRISEVDNAYITTFDSFSLAIVKKYHIKMNLSANISIVDDCLLNVKKNEILDNIFNEYYSINDANFNRLIKELTNKNDTTLKEEILKIASKIDLKTNRDEFLNSYLANYFNDDYYNKIYNEYMDLLYEKLDFIKENLILIKNLDEDKFLKIYTKLQELLDSKSYEMISANCNIQFPILKNLEENIKILKDTIKDTLDELKELCIYKDSKQIKECYFNSYDYVLILIDILKKYFKQIDEYKLKYEMFEFIDISKMAIKVVRDNKSIQEELRNTFKEILVDEYQDTNDIQEEFISYISNNNVYMVGDVKQSIYGFRNANPLIFKEKYDLYSKHINGKKIDLNNNFRSNRVVLKTINDIFDHIMDDAIGNANFKESHRMHFGLLDYEKKSNENKITFIQYLKNKDLYKSKDVDMFYVAKDILYKINNKEQVYDKDSKEFRDCTYKDFAILMSDSSLFDSLEKLLSYNHIPCLVFKNVEVGSGEIIILLKNIVNLIVLDYSKIYDESFKHSFLSVARSFIMSYSDEEIFDYLSLNTFKESQLYNIIHKLSKEICIKPFVNVFEEILDEFNIYEKLITIGNVKQNITRIEYLLNLISSFEKLDLTIFDFNSYIDSIYKNNDKMEFQSSGLTSNKVKIMTIHKSKGLEFPIVYFINNDKEFNKSEYKDKLIYDNKYGFIAPFYLNGEGKNINFLLMKENNKVSMISEKIRLLYVALTRAREQMIVLNQLTGKEYALDDEIFSIAYRKKYNSFKAIYASLNNVLKDNIKEIDPLTLNINDDYLKASSANYNDYFKKIDSKIVNKTNINNSHEITLAHASKDEVALIEGSIKEIMEKGIAYHKLFEGVDFKNYDASLYNKNENKLITNFLNQDINKNIKNANIYKEYEFIYLDDNKQIHGIIDLMLEYDTYINIIDYKLSHTEDEAYIKQLNSYKKYIEGKSNKKVNIYLYSILKNEIIRLN